MEEKSTRRVFLTTIGAASAVTLAGCSSIGGGGNEPASPGTKTTGGGSSDGTDGSGTDNGTKTPDKSKIPGKVLSTFTRKEFKNNKWQTLDGAVTVGVKDAVHNGQSVKLTPKQDANEKASTIRHEYQFDNRLDLSNHDLALAAKVRKPQDEPVRIRAAIGTAGKDLVCKRQFPTNFKGWARFDIGYADAIKGTALNKVNQIDIQINRGGGDYSVLIDDLRRIPKAKKGKVMIQLDDAHISQYENAFEILKAQDMRASVGIIPDSLHGDDRISYEQIKEMAKAGFEMNAHGAWKAGDKSKKEQVALMQRAKSYVQALGFKSGAEHFVYPYGDMNSQSLAAAKEVFSSAYVQGNMPNNAKNPVNPQFMSRIDGTAITESRDILEAAEAYNQLVVLKFHEVGDYDTGTSISAGDFKSQLEYIKSRDLDVIVPSELF